MNWHLLITGASSGIGEAIARAALARGARVTLVARRRSLLEQIAQSAPDRCRVIEADLSQLEVAERVLDDAASGHGPVDVLVNNAGRQIVAPTVATEWNDALSMMRLDLLMPMRLATLILPKMIERGQGTLVDIASMAGIAPTPGMYFYNAAKAGLAAASEGLRAEVKRHGIHVVTVYPGPVSTELERAGRAAYEESFMVRAVPTGRAEVLAERIFDAIEHRRPRVIYPRIYALSRHFPNATRWLLDAMTPPAKQLGR